jgi:hypothetical protein
MIPTRKREIARFLAEIGCIIIYVRHRAMDTKKGRDIAIRIVWAISVLVILLIIFRMAVPDSWGYREQFADSQELIQAIEEFRVTSHRLPDNEEVYRLMEHLGWTPSEACPCYNKESSEEYIVYFGTTLGESKVYHSTTGEWNDF